MRSFKSAWKDRARRRLIERAGYWPPAREGLWAAGERSGVWTVDPSRLHAKSLVYSFGIGDNTAFEVALVERFGLRLLAFDPTPRALAHAESAGLAERMEVHAIGLAPFDGEQAFREPRSERSVNFVPLEGADSRGAVKFPVRTLATLMAENGHHWLDVLKMDIEGGEVPVLESLFETGGPPADQVLIEFHHQANGERFAATERLLCAFEEHGYDLLHVSHRGLEMTFAKRPQRVLV